MKAGVLQGRLWIALMVLAVGVTAGTVTHAATVTVNPGESIQAAINAASVGDTVLVSPGV